MTKLTGPFLIERVYHEVNARRNCRYLPRRKPRTAETLERALTLVSDAQNAPYSLACLSQDLGADGTSKPQLPDKCGRHPWWSALSSRPATQESALPEMAVKVREGTSESLQGRLKPVRSTGNLGLQSRSTSAERLAPPDVVRLALELNEHRSQSASTPASAKFYSEPEPAPLSARLKQLPKLKRAVSFVPAWDHCQDDQNLIAVAHLTGFATRCSKCLSNLGDDKTKYCRGCGDPRLENKFIGEVFFAYIGNKRTIMRKTDLSKLIQHMRYLQNKEESLTRQALHRVTYEINRFFDQMLGFQMQEGSPHSCGLTMEYFAFFLGKVANSRSITVKDLITFLLEELHGQKHNAPTVEDAGTSSPEVPSRMRDSAISAVRAIADQCPRCGMYADGNHFCQKCGHKLREVAEGTAASSGSDFASVFQKKGRKTLLNGSECEAAFASQYNMSLDEVRRRKQEFQAYDKNNSGTLTYPEFIEAVRHRTNIPAPAPIPEHLLNRWHNTVHHSHDEGDCLNFEEFLIWSCNTEYSEEVLVTDTQERELRKLARENGLCLPEVERIKAVFDKYDRDKSGYIDEEEFRKVLLMLMKVKNPADLPYSKVRRCWRDLDTDLSGQVTFDEFLFWYLDYDGN